MDWRIRALLRRPIADEPLATEVHSPNLGNSMTCIERHLLFAVEAKGARSDFDDQKHVLRHRVMRAIEILARP
jgi:hypothetical protein